MKTFTLYRMLGTISFLFLLAACGQSELEECATNAVRQTDKAVPDSVRVVPLYVYMEGAEEESRALPSDYGVNFWTSWGEKAPHLSVARNLRFYVFQRDAGSAGEFLYVSSLSDNLSSTWSILRYEDNYYGKPFYVREFQFQKEEGKEYKILVTAFGEKNEDEGSIGEQVTGVYAACCPLKYTGKDGAELVDDTPLSELQAAIVPKSTYEPKIRTTIFTGFEYENSVGVYSLQENFYGFCEQQESEAGDVHIITFDDKTALRAYLYRNVAKVIFKIQNMYYDSVSGTEFQWAGIYANNVTMDVDADNYDKFKVAKHEDGWKLLTYFKDENVENKNSNTISGFGNHKFKKKDDAGEYKLVTYMLPTTTTFRIRIARNYLSTRYCDQYKVPIRGLNSASGSNATGVVDEVIVSTDEIRIERNKEYIIHINYRVLIESSNDLDV